MSAAGVIVRTAVVSVVMDVGNIEVKVATVVEIVEILVVVELLDVVELAVDEEVGLLMIVVVEVEIEIEVVVEFGSSVNVDEVVGQLLNIRHSCAVASAGSSNWISFICYIETIVGLSRKNLY